MTKKTKMWLALGGGALVLGAGGYYLYKKQQAAQTPAQLPAGTPVTSFSQGVKYQFAALLPASITDTSALETALNAAGWTNVHIDFFMGTGDAGSFPINANGYVATATWNKASTSVPQGVVARTA